MNIEMSEYTNWFALILVIGIIGVSITAAVWHSAVYVSDLKWNVYEGAIEKGVNPVIFKCLSSQSDVITLDAEFFDDGTLKHLKCQIDPKG